MADVPPSLLFDEAIALLEPSKHRCGIDVMFALEQARTFVPVHPHKLGNIATPPFDQVASSPAYSDRVYP